MRNTDELLKELQTKIGYEFKDVSLLRQAITHSSFSNEQKINRTKNYERIEFLGDAVLELVSSEFLYKEHPDMPEGQLTRLRASMVCEPALAFCARDIDLSSYILLGRGEESTGGRGRDSIVSDVMEAVIGAIFLDSGIEEAKKYIYRFILTDLEDKILFIDSKTILQEEVQKTSGAKLSYKLISETGPDHDKEFKVEAYLDDSLIGEGVGHTKKAAQQQAAYKALLKMGVKKKF